MTRAKKNRVNQDRSKVINTGPRTRKLVECKCLLHCNGSKWVDPRTFEIHKKELNQLQTIASGSHSSSRSTDTISNPIHVESPSGKKEKVKNEKKSG